MPYPVTATRATTPAAATTMPLRRGGPGGGLTAGQAKSVLLAYVMRLDVPASCAFGRSNRFWKITVASSSVADTESGPRPSSG
jgi:hypothetical protein